MTDKTTSDQLKHFFAQHGGGDEKDWKRTSKKKNDEGQVVRQFENRKTGVQLEVVETAPGQFKARRLSADANASFAPPAAEELTRKPVIETNADKNAAADKVIEKLAEYDEEIATSLLKKAGTALANRFVFAIGGDVNGGLLDSLFAEISPKGLDYDQHLEHVISHLLPKNNGGEAMELTFDFSGYKDPVRLVSDLQKNGFIWDETYQAQMDASTGQNYLALVKAAFAAPAATATPAPKPPAL
ncbi:MAG: hypothetical protein PW788_15855 [Micavibrio sp.]|nr:hypothetical protein [Micavibrio sp.]